MKIYSERIYVPEGEIRGTITVEDRKIIAVEKDIKDNYKIMELSEINGKSFLNEVVGETNLKTILPLFVNNMVK